MRFVEPLEKRQLFAAGLQATYYNNSNFTGQNVSRVDPTVNFTWSGAPVSPLGSDTFSVRWTGQLQAPSSGTFTFYTQSDDGVRLWVNHKLIIDNWTLHSSTENRGTIALTSGVKYDVQLEFFDNTGGATAKLSYSGPGVAKQIIPSSRLFSAAQNAASKVDHAVVFAQAQLQRTLADLGSSTSTYVSTSKSDGTWNKITASNWMSGFFPGALWQMYTSTGNSYWKTQATNMTLGLKDARFQQEDLAFRLMTTFKPLYEATGNTTYRQYLLDAAASKNARWNETVGAFQTTWRKSNSGDPRANFGVLMDQTTDLELMFWAAKQTGNQTYYDRAMRHLQKVMTYLVRPDGSTYQWGYFDSATGNFISGETYQGYSNTSTWARGQAWAILSFANAAHDTGSAEAIAGARRVADWFLAHLPASQVPYWDFDHPSIPNTYRDSSAAAIAASGMFQLAKMLGNDPAAAAKYRSAAEKILAALASPPFIAEGHASRGLLLHGAQDVPHNVAVDASMIFGDYYFLEAINRYWRLS